MKKFLVIGNPIEHSLSPKLQNYWIKNNGIKAIYGKLETLETDLPELCNNLKKGELDGLNVTIPFKKTIIPFLDTLSGNSLQTHSVNTISVENGNLIGHNTDIDGFELSIRKLNFDISNKKILVLGAGGVVHSIIYALIKMKISKIYISNRTKEKAENLKNLFKDLEVIDWGILPDFDVIINATSLGLNKSDKFGIDFNKAGVNKLFYDVIYDPFNTEFSEAGSKPKNILENGLNMFLFQAQKAFQVWHNINPEINDDVISFIKNKKNEIK